MNTYQENLRRKDEMKRLYDQDKLREVTGKPLISEKARSLNRGVNDLLNWQKEAQKRKEDLQKQKEDKENKELEFHQQ